MAEGDDFVCREELDVTWDNLTYTVMVKGDDGERVPKVLLKGVSGTARRARLVAVMGPSGAGKSTFLNALSGRLTIDDTHQLKGTAYLNDILLLTRYKPLMSYVAQDDIVMGKTTPREALNFSYRMRSGASSEEADRRVEAMLKRLSLTKCAETLLGVPGLIKGVSGGEKKRSNIGAELINNPLIMLLDEPTTGLDSVNALRVGELLRELAHEERRTVICTIHTPSSELFEVFDDLLLLARGHVIYHGSREDALTYFADVGHPVPPRVNPSEHYMKVLQLDPDTLDQLAARWKEHVAAPDCRNLCVNQIPQRVRTEGDPHLDSLLKVSNVHWTLEMQLLMQRAWLVTSRDPRGTFGRAAQEMFLAVLMALFFANLSVNGNSGVQDREGVLFMQTINLIFANVSPAIVSFPPERAVFLQEQRNSMYNAFRYFFAKVFSELPLVLILPTMYTLITYWSWGLVNTPVAFFNNYVLCLCVANTANAFGLFAASLFPRVEIAFTLLPLLVLPQMVVAGLFANTARLDPYWIWLNKIAFPRYAYKGFMVNQFTHIGTLCNATGPSCRFANGAEVLTYEGFDKSLDTVWFSVVMLLVLMLFFWFIGALALWIQGRMARSRLVFQENYLESPTGKQDTEMVVQSAL